MIARLLFGHPGDLCDRHQGLLVAGLFVAICVVDSLVGLV